MKMISILNLHVPFVSKLDFDRQERICLAFHVVLKDKFW